MCEHKWIEHLTYYPDQTNPYTHFHWSRCLECNLYQKVIDEENYYSSASTMRAPETTPDAIKGNGCGQRGG